MDDLISRKAAIDAHYEYCNKHPDAGFPVWSLKILKDLPSAQPEIVLCNECEYGAQDEVGRWFCRSLGCQIGNEDGSGYCADAERRTND